MDTIKLALAQVQGQTTPAKNIATARQIVTQAAREKAVLVVFPEMFMATLNGTVQAAQVGEPLTGHFVTALGEIAREHGVHIVAGVWEQVPNAKRVANTAVIISPEAGPIAAYRKLHLFDALGTKESDRMVPGSSPSPVVSIGGFQVGLAICYDLRFPEPFRRLARQGVDLILVPSAWYAGPFKEEHWLTLLQARAIENTVYLAGANLTGALFCGRSAVFDPFGVQLAAGGETAGLVTAELSLARLAEVRTKLPCLTHIREDLFT